MTDVALAGAVIHEKEAAVLALLALCASAGATRFQGLRIDSEVPPLSWDEAITHLRMLAKPRKLRATLEPAGVIVVQSGPFPEQELAGWLSRAGRGHAGHPTVDPESRQAPGELLLAIAGEVTQVVAADALQIFRQQYLITPLSSASDTAESVWARQRGYSALAHGKAERIISFSNNVGVSFSLRLF